MNSLKIDFNIISGKKSIFELKDQLNKIKLKKPLVVCDKNLYKKNKYIFNFINDNNFSYIDFYEYNFEPSYELLEYKIFEYLKKKYNSKIDCIIAIGGGSTIDFVKGIALLLKNLKKKPVTFRGFPKKYFSPLPVIAIPSTCGTGSEVVFNASFIHEKSKTKLGINVIENYPVLSILDPLIIKNSPKRVMYSSLCDTLVHIIEGFTSVKSNTTSKYFSKLAFKLFKDNVLGIINNPNNVDKILNLQWASSFAMVGMSNSSHGVSGALSYFLGSHYGINHGIAGGYFLYKIFSFNHSKGYFGLAKLVDDNKKNQKQQSLEVLKFIKNILKVFLKEFNLEDVEQKLVHDKNFVDFLSKIESTFLLNPIKITKKDIMESL